jgi:glycerol-3-phosphate dehydrogenase
MTDARISALERESNLAKSANETFDLAIIGGGITGAGIARLASSLGLRCVLLEANDFASGTSSRSSKLIHGGLRYLPKGEVDLVRKTARERKEVHRIAPHLATRKMMVLPAATRAFYYTLRTALSTYERLGAVARRDKHENWNRAALATTEPLLDTRAFPWAVAYREYLTDDARLVLANIRAAVRDGCLALNRARVVGVISEGERSIGVQVQDTLEPAAPPIPVRAKVIVNAAGPWVEDLLRIERPGTKAMMTLTKGIHVVLPRERLPLSHTWVINASDNRPIFAVPRGEVVYLGTTDTVYDDPATVWPTITRHEVEYLLATLPKQFKVDPIAKSEVVSAWAGLRGLVAQPGKKPSEISRNEEVLESPGGLISVAGGKLTGYRGIAKRVLELVGHRLRPFDIDLSREGSLPGGDFDGEMAPLQDELARRHDISGSLAQRLAHLYGTESHTVIAAGPERLTPGIDILRGEIEFAMTHEGALSLEDVFYRRTRAALYTVRGIEAVGEMADCMASRLGWDDERRAHELRSVRQRFAEDLDFAEGPRLDAEDAYENMMG